MAGNKRQRLKEAAVHSLRVGRPEEALIAGRHLAQEDPTDAEAFQIQGLALAQQGDADAATLAFREAVRLDPTEGKHPFNLAAHLAALGQKEEARFAAAEAVRVSPTHKEARHLLEVLEGRADPNASEPHLLPWMRGREDLWDRSGQVLMGMAGVLAVLMITRIPAQPSGKKVKTGQLPDVILKADLLSQFTIFLLIVSTLGTFLWMLTDIIDRRKRFTWLVPITICGLMGLNLFPLALYYFMGRKLNDSGVSKA